MFCCQFCKREAKTRQSNVGHEIYCKNNPNKIKSHKGTNQYIKGTAKPLSQEARTKISLSSIESNKRYWNDSTKNDQSARMKQAVKDHPESYTGSNRGRVKQIEYNGIKFHGNWELEFYKWCEISNIQIIRNSLWFDYKWNGKRKYNPDFYLPEFDWFVEVKGYKTDRDSAKWSQFPFTLKIISKPEIKRIRENTFSF